MNKINNAIELNQFSNFLLGKDSYALLGRSENDDPNDYLFCWESEIIPYSKGSEDVGKLLEKSFREILRVEDDGNLIQNIYTVVNHIFWYYYFRNKRSIGFNIQLNEIQGLLRSLLTDNRSKLISTEKWAGASWNSKEGLWEPIQNIAKSIKNNYNGIDFIVE